MTLHKKLFIIASLLCTSSLCYAQVEKVYFFADTTNIKKENRIFEINSDAIYYSFTFYCKCLPPYNRYLQFSYFNGAGSERIITLEKPKVKYSSVKELLDKVPLHRTYYPKYEFYFTEIIYGNMYKTRKVDIEYPIPPTEDFEILPARKFKKKDKN